MIPDTEQRLVTGDDLANDWISHLLSIGGFFASLLVLWGVFSFELIPLG